ncbi:hypothetical protein [Kinneretia aquatilis]|uniref:hypothetical protein n=1 Tax=Kinneretia aquatilis TaxID=2070761 RepID=UPI00149524F5|nr:hypothetical protein [Paucibacter aquatile]WIV96462.1 hypothetical protein K9V56_015635 [Paucibacter aquatile]
MSLPDLGLMGPHTRLHLGALLRMLTRRLLGLALPGLGAQTRRAMGHRRGRSSNPGLTRRTTEAHLFFDRRRGGIGGLQQAFRATLALAGGELQLTLTHPFTLRLGSRTTQAGLNGISLALQRLHFGPVAQALGQQAIIDGKLLVASLPGLCITRQSLGLGLLDLLQTQRLAD